MTQIWKFSLTLSQSQTIMVPAGAEKLCVKEKDGQIAVWFACDPKARKKEK